MSALLISDYWPPLSKAAAMSFGLSVYFDGPECKNGHAAGRYISDHSCVACRKTGRPSAEVLSQRSRAYYLKNRESIIARTVAYQASRLQERREWYRARKDRDPEAFKRWYAENSEAYREKARARRAAAPDTYAVHSRNRRAREAAAEGFHTGDDIVSLRQKQGDKCASCQVSLKGRGHVDHVQPLSKGGTNWPHNLQLLCRSCNLSKHNLDPLQFARRKGRLL